MKTPVALLIFNRPETTARVFAAIREARPATLFVVADGPRENHKQDLARCCESRRIVERIDWPCELAKEYSEINLGCGRRVSTGLDWVFKQVEEAVILEDDCVPARSFFDFCGELLERFRYEDRVMHIGGINSLFGALPRAESYYFSRYAHVWGWASWRRAWRHYDMELAAWKDGGEDFREAFLAQFSDLRERAYWRQVLNATAAGQIDTWDYQWTFACMHNSGLAVVPACNLVHNVGFDQQATHTKRVSRLSALSAEEIEFPLIHPTSLERDKTADVLAAQAHFRGLSLGNRLLAKVKALAASVVCGSPVS
jgi:hypothetical protein